MLIGTVASARPTAGVAPPGPLVLSITPAGNAGSNAAATTSKFFDMPATVATGDLLLAILAIDDDPAVSVPPTDWDLLATPHVTIVIGSKVYWKISDGTEGGTTVGLTLGSNKFLAGHTYRIAAGTFDPLFPPEISLIPSWGYANNLFIRAGATDRNPTVDSYPYTAGNTYTSTGGADASACGAYSCWKIIPSDDEDSAPEDFTFGSTAFSTQIGFQIVVPPANLGLFAQYTYPSGVLGGDYYFTDPAVVWRGTPPYVFTVHAGSLPPGLDLDPDTGGITGTPTDDGVYAFTIRCTDDAAETFDAALSIEIELLPLEIVGEYGDGVVGEDYAESPVFRYGRPPYAFTLEAGSLPTGTSLNATTGLIEGLPITPGTYSVTVRCTDDDSNFEEIEDDIEIVTP